MKVITDSGTPVWVNGTGKTIILIHGVLVDHRMWQRQVDELSQHFEICCIDMLGHGESSDKPGDRVLNDFVNQANEVVDRFSETDLRCSVVSQWAASLPRPTPSSITKNYLA